MFREVCFVDAGIPLTRQHEEYENDDVPLVELVEIIRAAQGKIHTKEPMTVEEYAVIDQDAPIPESALPEAFGKISAVIDR